MDYVKSTLPSEGSQNLGGINAPQDSPLCANELVLSVDHFPTDSNTTDYGTWSVVQCVQDGG